MNNLCNIYIASPTCMAVNPEQKGSKFTYMLATLKIRNMNKIMLMEILCLGHGKVMQKWFGFFPNGAQRRNQIVG